MLLFFSCQELVNNDQQRALTSRTPPRESSKSPTRAVSWVNRLFCSETDCTLVNWSRQRSPRQRTVPTPIVEFSVPPRGFQRGQGQHPWWRPTHPLVFATCRLRPVVVFLHSCAGDP